jgi:hypothetical protein
MFSYYPLVGEVLFLAFIIPVLGAAMNETATVPTNDSNHGDPNLLCRPSRWTDIATFFLGNYIAHAATIMTIPGESAL